MTAKPKREPCTSLCGHGRIGSTLQASVFSPSDLNIKPPADLHSCDAGCTGAALSHRTAHVLINMAPTVLSIPPARARSSSPLTHAKSTCVWCVASHFSDSFLLWSLLWCSSLCDSSDSSLSRHLSHGLLSGMWCRLGLLYLQLCTHICTPDV